MLHRTRYRLGPWPEAPPRGQARQQASPLALGEDGDAGGGGGSVVPVDHRIEQDLMGLAVGHRDLATQADAGQVPGEGDSLGDGRASRHAAVRQGDGQFKDGKIAVVLPVVHGRHHSVIFVPSSPRARPNIGAGSKKILITAAAFPYLRLINRNCAEEVQATAITILCVWAPLAGKCHAAADRSGAWCSPARSPINPGSSRPSAVLCRKNGGRNGPLPFVSVGCQLWSGEAAFGL